MRATVDGVRQQSRKADLGEGSVIGGEADEGVQRRPQQPPQLVQLLHMEVKTA